LQIRSIHEYYQQDQYAKTAAPLRVSALDESLRDRRQMLKQGSFADEQAWWKCHAFKQEEAAYSRCGTKLPHAWTALQAALTSTAAIGCLT
jgi:hypothetical protein